MQDSHLSRLSGHWRRWFCGVCSSAQVDLYSKPSKNLNFFSFFIFSSPHYSGWAFTKNNPCINTRLNRILCGVLHVLLALTWLSLVWIFSSGWYPVQSTWPNNKFLCLVVSLKMQPDSGTSKLNSTYRYKCILWDCWATLLWWHHHNSVNRKRMD